MELIQILLNNNYVFVHDSEDFQKALNLDQSFKIKRDKYNGLSINFEIEDVTPKEFQSVLTIILIDLDVKQESKYLSYFAGNKFKIETFEKIFKSLNYPKIEINPLNYYYEEMMFNKFGDDYSKYFIFTPMKTTVVPPNSVPKNIASPIFDDPKIYNIPAKAEQKNEKMKNSELLKVAMQIENIIKDIPQSDFVKIKNIIENFEGV